MNIPITYGVIAGRGGSGKTTLFNLSDAGVNREEEIERTEQAELKIMDVKEIENPNLEVGIEYMGKSEKPVMAWIDVIGQTDDINKTLKQMTYLAFTKKPSIVVVLDGEANAFGPSINAMNNIWKPGIEKYLTGCRSPPLSWDLASKSLYLSKILKNTSIAKPTIDEKTQVATFDTNRLGRLFDYAEANNIQYICGGDARGISGDGRTPARMWAFYLDAKNEICASEVSVTAPFTEPAIDVMLSKPAKGLSLTNEARQRAQLDNYKIDWS